MTAGRPSPAHHRKVRDVDNPLGPLFDTGTTNFSSPDSGRRATDWILAHWQSARPDSTGRPTLADLALGDQPKIRENCFLLRMDPYIRQSVFILCGENVGGFLGVDPIGLTMDVVLPRNIKAQFRQACEHAMVEGRPMQVDGHYSGQDGGEVGYRSIAAPVRSTHHQESGYMLGTYGQMAVSRRLVA